MRSPGPVKVVSVSLDEPLRAVSVEDRYVGVLLVVLAHGTVVGSIRLPALQMFSADLLRRLIAFTDDDCAVDPHWLDGLAEPFADTLVTAVTGHVAPVELETPAQILFEQHGGFGRGLEPKVFDGAKVSPVRVAGRVGAGAN